MLSWLLQDQNCTFTWTGTLLSRHHPVRPAGRGIADVSRCSHKLGESQTTRRAGLVLALEAAEHVKCPKRARYDTTRCDATWQYYRPTCAANSSKANSGQGLAVSSGKQGLSSAARGETGAQAPTYVVQILLPLRLWTIDQPATLAFPGTSPAAVPALGAMRPECAVTRCETLVAHNDRIALTVTAHPFHHPQLLLRSHSSSRGAAVSQRGAGPAQWDEIVREKLLQTSNSKQSSPLFPSPTLQLSIASPMAPPPPAYGPGPPTLATPRAPSSSPFPNSRSLCAQVRSIANILYCFPPYRPAVPSFPTLLSPPFPSSSTLSLLQLLTYKSSKSSLEPVYPPISLAQLHSSHVYP